MRCALFGGRVRGVKGRALIEATGRVARAGRDELRAVELAAPTVEQLIEPQESVIARGIRLRNG